MKINSETVCILVKWEKVWSETFITTFFLKYVLTLDTFENATIYTMHFCIRIVLNECKTIKKKCDTSLQKIKLYLNITFIFMNIMHICYYFVSD